MYWKFFSFSSNTSNDEKRLDSGKTAVAIVVAFQILKHNILGNFVIRREKKASATKFAVQRHFSRDNSVRGRDYFARLINK